MDRGAEQQLGVDGLAIDDFRYPSKLVAARGKVAELEAALAGLKAAAAAEPVVESAP